jgi:hypothetical protein
MSSSLGVGIIGAGPVTQAIHLPTLATLADRLRVPGRAALVLGDRSTSLTRSLRVSNARFRGATGWAPRYANARDRWIATATALDQR